jgi:hypothetical protein
MHLVIAVLKVFSVSVPTERKRCNVCVSKPVYVHNDRPSPEYPYFGGRATPSLYTPWCEYLFLVGYL